MTAAVDLETEIDNPQERLGGNLAFEIEWIEHDAALVLGGDVADERDSMFEQVHGNTAVSVPRC